MTTPAPEPPDRDAAIHAAHTLLGHLGLTPTDLLSQPTSRPPIPTFRDYIPQVSNAVSPSTRRVYGTYWKKIDNEWGAPHPRSTPSHRDRPPGRVHPGQRGRAPQRPRRARCR